MNEILTQLEWVLDRHEGSTASLYDQVAPHYETFRQLWIELAGQQAEQAMLGDLAEILVGSPTVLDAGCGTGAMTREVLAFCPDARVTLVDASEGMLAQAGDLGERRLQADLAELPFADESFDVVVCAWVIETVADPKAVVTELLRVLKPEGHLLYTFCSLPDGVLSRAATALFRNRVTEGFAGDFLDAEDTPWHDCPRSRRFKSDVGLSTYILLRKCCAVEPGVLPPVGPGDVPQTLL